MLSTLFVTVLITMGAQATPIHEMHKARFRNLVAESGTTSAVTTTDAPTTSGTTSAVTTIDAPTTDAPTTLSQAQKFQGKHICESLAEECSKRACMNCLRWVDDTQKLRQRTDKERERGESMFTTKEYPWTFAASVTMFTPQERCKSTRTPGHPTEGFQFSAECPCTLVRPLNGGQVAVLHPLPSPENRICCVTDATNNPIHCEWQEFFATEQERRTLKRLRHIVAAFRKTDVSSDPEEILKHMDAKGVELQDKNGWTALHFAALYGYADCVELLLKRMDAKGVELQELGGSTALHVAAYHGHADCVELLLKHMDREGVELKDDEGNTAKQDAQNQGHTNCVNLFTKHRY